MHPRTGRRQHSHSTAVYTRRFAQEGKIHRITINMQSGQRSVIEHSFFMIDRTAVVANWRLDNSKSPAAMLQEKAARTPYTLRVAGGCRTYVALYARSHAVRTYITEVPVG